MWAVVDRKTGKIVSTSALKKNIQGWYNKQKYAFEKYPTKGTDAYDQWLTYITLKYFHK